MGGFVVVVLLDDVVLLDVVVVGFVVVVLLDVVLLDVVVVGLVVVVLLDVVLLDVVVGLVVVVDVVVVLPGGAGVWAMTLNASMVWKKRVPSTISGSPNWRLPSRTNAPFSVIFVERPTLTKYVLCVANCVILNRWWPSRR